MGIDPPQRACGQMTNDEIRMTKECRMTNDEHTVRGLERLRAHGSSAGVGGGGGFVEEFAVGVESPDLAGGLVENEAAIAGGIFEIRFGLAAEDEDAGVAVEGIARVVSQIGAVVGVLGKLSVIGGALGEGFPAI